MAGCHTVGLEKRWIFSKLIIDDMCCIDGTRNKKIKLQKWTDFTSETVKKTNSNQEDSKKEKVGRNVKNLWAIKQEERNWVLTMATARGEWMRRDSVDKQNTGTFFRSIHAPTVLSPSKPSIAAAGVSTWWLFGDDALILLSLSLWSLLLVKKSTACFP